MFDSKPAVCLHGSTWFQCLRLWTRAHFEKGGTRGVQKIPLEEKVLHHGETSTPLIVKNEVQLEIPIAGRHWEVKYSARERESFQIFAVY